MTSARRGSGSESSSNANQPPPFLTKTYDLVDDVSTDAIVSWSPDGRSFVVWKPPEFSRDLLPRHFKHNNFSSFVRQLNTYGFRKVDPDRWEFANDSFIRGRRDLLKDIHRRKPTGQQQALAPAGHQTAIELGHYGGVHDEIESLKRDKNVLMLELVRLRQQQQAADQRMREMHERMESQEQRQNTIVNFLARVAQNPTVLQQMVSVAQSAGLQRLSSQRGGRKKRRGRSGDNSDESGGAVPPEQNHAQIIQYQPANAVFARTTSQGLADIEAAAALLASSHIDPAAAAAAGPSGRLQQLHHQGGMTVEPSVLIHEQPNMSFGGGIPTVGLDGIAHPGMTAAEAADFSAAADIAAAAAFDGLVADPAAAAAAAAAGLPNVLLYGNPLQPQLQQLQQPVIDPAAAAAAAVPDLGSDYTQTTTITEVPCMATPAAGGSMQRVPSQQRVPMAAMAAGATTVITPGGATTTMHAAGKPAAAAAAAAAGVQVLSPLEVKVESPTVAAAAAAAAAAGAGGAMLMDAQQPKVDSPEGDLDMSMDILSNLSHMNSADLMMTDDVNKDDLWDMLFGQQGSGAMMSGHSFGSVGEMAAAAAALGADSSAAAAAASPVGAGVSSPTLR